MKYTQEENKNKIRRTKNKKNKKNNEKKMKKKMMTTMTRLISAPPVLFAVAKNPPPLGVLRQERTLEVGKVVGWSTVW